MFRFWKWKDYIESEKLFWNVVVVVVMFLMILKGFLGVMWRFWLVVVVIVLVLMDIVVIEVGEDVWF